jgi:hypothetical protein
MKQAIYADLAKRLEAECGVPPEDLIVSCNQNTKEDWSFGFVLPSFLLFLRIFWLVYLTCLLLCLCLSHDAIVQNGQGSVPDWRSLGSVGKEDLTWAFYSMVVLLQQRSSRQQRGIGFSILTRRAHVPFVSSCKRSRTDTYASDPVRKGSIHQKEKGPVRVARYQEVRLRPLQGFNTTSDGREIKI